MERNLFKYIWRNSWRDQALILVVVAVAQVFYFISLDLPKRIVNDAIQGEAFGATSMTAPIGRISIGPIDWLGLPEFTIFEGLELDRLGYLIALCFAFLFFVVLNGWMKQKVNTEKGRLGERMLRRLRYELFDRILRFPLGYFRKVKSAEMATMIKDEVEPLGGFIGDAFIQPAFLGGQALTALFFIMAQSFWLGMVTIFVLAVQLIVIPRMRIKILQLGKQRQLTARQLAGRIADVVDGSAEIHVNDTSNYERADIVSRLERIFLIRFELYQRKFFVKYINNMLSQTTPFLFYLIGGWLALTGRFDIGSLVAAINAYKDLPSPIKELIDWDQQRQDVQIKYEQVIEQFTPENIMPPELQAIHDEIELPQGGYVLNNVTAYDEGGARLIEDASIEIAPDHHLAVIGPNGSGKEALGQLLARLLQPASGTLHLGQKHLGDYTEAVTGRFLSYVGEETFLLPGSILENITYGIKHRPIRPATYEGRELQHFERCMMEADRSGNPKFDIRAEWIDYQEAGVSGPKELNQRIIDLLPELELEEDVYHFGLRGRIDPEHNPELASRFLEARRLLKDRLQEPAYADLVEVFDPDRYIQNMTVAENLLFGTAKGAAFAIEALRDNQVVAQVIDSQGLRRDLMSMGAKIAETMVELFADLPPGHPFFEQFSFIAADDLPGFEQLVTRIQRSGLDQLAPADQNRLVGLTFPYIEARHRLGLIDDRMEARLLEARRAFAKALPDDLKGSIEFYDPAEYNASATVQDNMLFGRLVYGQAQAAQKVLRLIVEVVKELDIKVDVLGVGLDYHVGSGGKRLSAAQRQKTAMLRGLIRNPQFLILNNALAPLDAVAQARIAARLRRLQRDRGLIVFTDNSALALDFDHIAVMKGGRIVERGPAKSVNKPGSHFAELASA